MKRPEEIVEDAMARGPEGAPMMVAPAEILGALYAAGWRIVQFYDVEPTMPARGTIADEWTP